jgi:hypothetical protein
MKRRKKRKRHRSRRGRDSTPNGRSRFMRTHSWWRESHLRRGHWVELISRYAPQARWWTNSFKMRRTSLTTTSMQTGSRRSRRMRLSGRELGRACFQLGTLKWRWMKWWVMLISCLALSLIRTTWWFSRISRQGSQVIPTIKAKSRVENPLTII